MESDSAGAGPVKGRSDSIAQCSSTGLGVEEYGRPSREDARSRSREG